MDSEKPDTLKDQYRLYDVEVNIGRGRWQGKGNTLIMPDESTLREAERLAKLHKADVRLLRTHPRPPVDCIAFASVVAMTRNGTMREGVTT